MSLQKDSTLETFHEVVWKHIYLTASELAQFQVILSQGDKYYYLTEADRNTHLLQKATS